LKNSFMTVLSLFAMPVRRVIGGMDDPITRKWPGDLLLCVTSM